MCAPILLSCCLGALLATWAPAYAQENAVDIYLFLDGDSPKEHARLLDEPAIKGAQVLYTWRRLEPKKDVYAFAPIEEDLRFMQKIHKALFIQIEDKTFEPQRKPVPDYLLTKEYAGGMAEQVDFPGQGVPIGAGWVTKQWNPKVRARFQLLLQKLAKQFDGRIAGIGLEETAMDFSKKQPEDFSCRGSFEAVLETMGAMRESFKKSFVLQYVNFIPCEWNNDRHFMERLFSFAREHKVSLGGPDVVPFRKGQMKNSYPFFHRYNTEFPLVAFAVQEPDYTYKDPQTERPFAPREIYDFSKDYLGARILFWTIQEPQYSRDVLPFFKTLKEDNNKGRA